MNRKIEILAPAGSYEGMRAAMNAGCDAVYIGGSSFGARAYAHNPEEDTLLRAIDEAHIRGKQLYLTVNTLLKEKELTEKLYRYLESYYRQGLDAVIVQDVGVLRFIHEHFPGLPIHASTQMTLTMAEGANLLKSYGVTRLVTARELSLKEIRMIRGNTELEIETFVHGALCYCYSGQCLMSSMIGGRSGNRGRCAQPCRMPYQFYSEDRKLSDGKERYLLSPRDINTIRMIPELIEAGIDSFKIEGRMKRPEYAALVAAMYRKYADLYYSLGKEGYGEYLQSGESRKDMIALQDIYNRGGFSEGYLNHCHGKKMMSLQRPNHSGVHVGEVRELRGSRIGIWLKEEVNAQDILEIRHREEEGHEFTVKAAHKPGDILWTNIGRRPENTVKSSNQRKSFHDGGIIGAEPGINMGDMVYRTRNNVLLDYLSKEYLEKDAKSGIKGKLTARTGNRLSLSLALGEHEVTAYQDTVQEAVKQPMTKEKLEVPIKKTGDTLFYFDELQVEMDENVFVPVAWLNELRREAVLLLQNAVTGHFRRELPADRALPAGDTCGYAKQLTDRPEGFKERYTGAVSGNSMPFSISVQSTEQFAAAADIPEVAVIHAQYETLTVSELLAMSGKAAAGGRSFYLALPHICRLSVYERLKKDLLQIIDKKEVTGFLVKNFEEIALLQSLLSVRGIQKELILNYNMYVYNREAGEFWREMGITHYTAPVELNCRELKTLGIDDCDMVVYGYLPVMVSAQCLFESTCGCRQKTDGKTGNLSRNEDVHYGTMTDRLGKNFSIRTNCRMCHNTIYNGQALALHRQAEEVRKLKPRALRLDFSNETGEQVRQVLSVFIDSFYYDKESEDKILDYTTGHFKRGVE